jgi:RimJ/RimL family protein N-acetyltransferase
MAESSSRQPVEITIRPVTWDDVPLMYEIGIDPASCEMAGVKPRTRQAFIERWKAIFQDPAVSTRIIEIITRDPSGAELAREFAGSISVFQAPGEDRDSIGYWIARAHWGKGIASRALALFLAQEPRRPLYATAATTNAASLRVLDRNGFKLVRTYLCEETDRYLAREVAEFVLDVAAGPVTR